MNKYKYLGRCCGVVYRFTESFYRNKKGVLTERNTLTPMKRLSCSGCEQCNWQEEIVSDSEQLESLFDGLVWNNLYFLDWVDEDCLEFIDFRNEFKVWR